MPGKTGLEFEMMLTNRRNGLKTIRYKFKRTRAGLGQEGNLPSKQRATGWRARLPNGQEGRTEPGSAVGSNSSLSEFNIKSQDNPKWINKACRGLEPSGRTCSAGAVICVSRSCFQMPSSQADAWKSSWNLGENRRNLILWDQTSYGSYQFNMGCLAALQLL